MNSAPKVRCSSCKSPPAVKRVSRSVAARCWGARAAACVVWKAWTIWWRPWLPCRPDRASSWWPSGNLVRMAKRIAGFFSAMPEHADAEAGVATQPQKFWEPRMHRQLLQAVAGEAGHELLPLVLEAVAAMQAAAEPAAA